MTNEPNDDYKEGYDVYEKNSLSGSITRVDSVDPLDLIKSFSKPSIVLVAEQLAGNDAGLKFADLKDRTGFDNNTLNRTLREMKAGGYIKQNGKVWNLTKFGFIVLMAVTKAKHVVIELTKTDMTAANPVSETKLECLG